MAKSYYLEDLHAGLRATSGEAVMQASEIKEFAGRFDPQFFHLDEIAARSSIFGGLVASGWHTAAMTMHLITSGGIPLAAGTVGAGIDELRWPHPVRPDDRLHIVSEILSVRPSQSKPDRGTVQVRVTTLNQNDVVVQSMIATLVVPRRPPQNAG